MKTVIVSTEVSRRYSTDIVMGDTNSVALKIKIVSPLDDEDIDYYLVHYKDKNNRKFISKQLHINGDGFIIDTLSRNMLLTAQLSLIVKGYDVDGIASVSKSPVIVLAIQKSNDRYDCNYDYSDGYSEQMKRVVETITIGNTTYYSDKNNITIPPPVAVKRTYMDEDYHLHVIYSDGTETDVGYVRGSIGPLPVKGVDYFTEDDINDIVSKMDINARGTFIVETAAELPNIGNSNVIYIVKSTDLMYRWDSESNQYKKLGTDVNEIKLLIGGGADGN